MKVIKLRNTNGATIVCNGQTIEDGEEHTLTPIEIDLFANDTTVMQYIDDGYVTVNYNGADLTPDEGQDALLGIYPYHRQHDELVHLVSEDSFEEVTYEVGNKVSSIIIYTDSGKTTKIREEQFTYDSWNRVTQILSIQYDSDGLETERMTEDFTYDGNRVTTVTRDVTLS
jgi:hypothetical protein